MPATQPAAEQPSSSRSAEEWTEVINEQTGQPYYWNQKTGMRSRDAQHSMLQDVTAPMLDLYDKQLQAALCCSRCDMACLGDDGVSPPSGCF